MKIKIVFLIIIFIISVAEINSQNWWNYSYSSKKLDINNISIPIDNYGGLNYRTEGTYWRYNSKDHYVVFDQGLWVFGKINNIVHLAFKQWGTLYSPGPIINNSAALNVQPEDSIKYRVYKIELNDTLNPGDDYKEWPGYFGAPVNEFGNPVINNDQTIWTTYNGMDSSLATRKWWNSNRDSLRLFPIEVRNIVYASSVDQPGWLNDVVFFEWLIINQGSELIDSVFLGIWTDIDFNSLHNIPAVDSTIQLGYCWSPDDSGYYIPLSVGYFLKYGPTVPSVGDTAFFDGVKKPNFKNLNLTSFHGIGDDSYIHPVHGPLSSLKYAWNFSKGLDGEGNAIIDPTTGLPTKFPFAGDPVTNTGYLFPVQWISGGAGFVMFTGPVTIAPQDTQWVMAALVVSTGNDYRDAIINLRNKASLLHDMDYDQLVRKYSFKPSIPELPPDKFSLSQNFPNPFNNETKIIFELPSNTIATITIYDVLGNKISILVNGELTADKYDVIFNGNNLASGVYFYQLRAGDYSETKKMMLLR